MSPTNHLRCEFQFPSIFDQLLVVLLRVRLLVKYKFQVLLSKLVPVAESTGYLHHVDKLPHHGHLIPTNVPCGAYNKVCISLLQLIYQLHLGEYPTLPSLPQAPVKQYRELNCKDFLALLVRSPVFVLIILTHTESFVLH